VGASWPPAALSRPHESGLPLPEEPALQGDFKADQTTLPGPRSERLDRLPLRNHKLKCLGCGQRPKELKIFGTAEQARAVELEADRPGPRY